MDLIGLLPPSTTGVKYIIVAIDHLTKWVEARAVKDLGARTVAKFVQEQIIHRHCCPQFLLTDIATNFTGRVLPKLNYLMGIRGVLTTPYHPESNGTVERVNATLERILGKLVVDKPSDWNNHLQSAVFAYNISYHSSTKHTPFQLLYGRQPALPPLLYTLIQESNTLSYYNYLRQLCTTLVNLQTETYSNLLLWKTKAHEKATLSRHPLVSFLVGEQVMFYHNRGFGRIN